METETVQSAPTTPKGKRKILIWASFSIFVICLFAFLLVFTYTRDTGVFYAKVSIAGIDLTELTQAKATQLIEEKLLPALTSELEFQVPDEEQTVKLSLKKLGLTYPLEEAIDEAWRIGREGNIFSKAVSKFKARSGIEFPLPAQWDQNQLEATLKESLESYNRSPQDASFKITADNQMVIEEEKVGREIDFTKLASDITQHTIEEALLEDPLLEEQQKGKPLEVITVPLSQEGVQPKITSAQLHEVKITGLIAQYSTQFDSGLVNRTENIRLAAKAIDGKTLAPGERFSFNETVGERTAEKGYKEALIIVGDEFTPGLGGGVCQVSSTLYNSVRLAQLEIVERHHHSLPVTYVPSGLDATVAYPALDFKFKNDSGAYVLIRSSVVGSTLTFKLYGKTKE